MGVLRWQMEATRCELGVNHCVSQLPKMTAVLAVF